MEPPSMRAALVPESAPSDALSVRELEAGKSAGASEAASARDPERKLTPTTEASEAELLSLGEDSDSKEALLEHAVEEDPTETKAWLTDAVKPNGLVDFELGMVGVPPRSCIFNTLAKLPALNTFGASLVLIFVLPRYYPIFGAWLCVLLFTYGMGKFFVTGVTAVRGLMKMANQEERMRSSKFVDVKPDPVDNVWSPLGQDEAPLMAKGQVPLSRSSSAAVVRSRDLDASEVNHCVLIPCYKESVDTISATVQTLAEQTVAHQITVVLAMEARDQTAAEVAGAVRDRFRSSRLRDIVWTQHQLKAGETAGKSSNENWGFRVAKRWLCDLKGLSAESLVFTTCDADTFFHPSHYEYLAHLFAESEDRHRTVWQGVVCFLPNNAHLPLLCMVRYMMLTVGYLGQLASPISPTGPFPLSCYSMSAKLADDADYWDPSVVPEDWHMFFKTNLETRPEGVICTPMFVPIGCLGVEASTHWQTFVECYKQAVRWQWGAIDIAYLLTTMWTSSTSWFRKAQLLVGLWEHHLLYPVMWVGLVTLPLLYPNECLEFQWPNIGIAVRGSDNQCVSGVPVHDLLWKLWLVFVVFNGGVLICLDWAYRMLVQGRTQFENVPAGRPSLLRCLSCFIFPLADITLFVLPTLQAHIRMFVSTDFVYIVSPKENLLKATQEAELAAMQP